MKQWYIPKNLICRYAIVIVSTPWWGRECVNYYYSLNHGMELHPYWQIRECGDASVFSCHIQGYSWKPRPTHALFSHSQLPSNHQIMRIKWLDRIKPLFLNRFWMVSSQDNKDWCSFDECLVRYPLEARNAPPNIKQSSFIWHVSTPALHLPNFVYERMPSFFIPSFLVLTFK